MCCVKLRYCGSMAEQLIRNEQVVSSILTSSSTLKPRSREACGVFTFYSIFGFYCVLTLICHLFLKNYIFLTFSISSSSCAALSSAL